MFRSNIEDHRATSKLVTVSRADGQNKPGAQEHLSTDGIEGPPGEYRPFFFFFYIIWRVQPYGYGALIANLIPSIDHTTATSPRVSHTTDTTLPGNEDKSQFSRRIPKGTLSPGLSLGISGHRLF